MPASLIVIVAVVSVSALTATAIWEPSRARKGFLQVLALLIALLAIDLEAPFVRGFLIGSGTVLVLLYRRDGQLTTAGVIAGCFFTTLVVLLYPPSWVITIAFLLGWANFIGSFPSVRRHPSTSAKERDFIDLAPLAAILLIGGTQVGSNPLLAGLLIFGALSFVINDVLASELGPVLPGEARLLPDIRAVPHGTPGAMSDGGTLIGLVGSLCVGTCLGALLLDPAAGVAVAAGGVLAAWADSLLCRTKLTFRLPRGRELINAAGMAIAIVISDLLVGR